MFQRTFENLLILRRILRPRRICDIYDLFAPFTNLLTHLLTLYAKCFIVLLLQIIPCLMPVAIKAFQAHGGKL